MYRIGIRFYLGEFRQQHSSGVPWIVEAGETGKRSQASINVLEVGARGLKKLTKRKGRKGKKKKRLRIFLSLSSGPICTPNFN